MSTKICAIWNTVLHILHKTVYGLYNVLKFIILLPIRIIKNFSWECLKEFVKDSGVYEFLTCLAVFYVPFYMIYGYFYFKKKDAIDNDFNVCFLVSDIISGIIFFVCYFFVVKSPDSIVGLFIMFPCIKIIIASIVALSYISYEYYLKVLYKKCLVECEKKGNKKDV